MPAARKERDCGRTTQTRESEKRRETARNGAEAQVKMRYLRFGADARLIRIDIRSNKYYPSI